MARILGVDIGGTVTDFFLWEEGRLSIYKLPPTPAPPSPVLERRGPRAALITTKGFRDVLAIGRQTRPKLYDLEPQRPPPLVPDDLRLEADERLDHRGRVLRALSP